MKFNLACVLFAVIGAANAFCAPEPTRSKVAGIWTLDVVLEHPQQISLVLPGDSSPTRYWYMILTVTNKSAQDVPFYPSIELVTDTMKIVRAGDNSRQPVIDKLKSRYKNRYPFLEPIEFATNKILPGQDNARDFLVIFPDFDPNARTAKIYISGLSNETKVIDHPSQKDPNTSKPVQVILKKTLELEYKAYGDRSLRDSQKLTFTGKRWVMR